MCPVNITAVNITACTLYYILVYGQHSLLHSQQLICDFCFSNWSDPQYDNLKNLSGEALLDIIYEMAPRPSETFGYMMWMGTWVDLDQNIDMIMTDMGMSLQNQTKKNLFLF